MFKENSWYFRNALVRANYENQKLNVENRRTDAANVGINVGINETEGWAMSLIRANPRLTAASLAAALSVEKQHAERP